MTNYPINYKNQYMMKFKLFAFFGLLLLSNFSFAQNNQEKLSVYFAPGRANLTSESKAALQQFAKEANQYTDYELDLRAFTDDIGSIQYNKKLSEKRAQAVETYLNQLNIKPTEKIVEGLGEVALFSDEDVSNQRKENRRVDLIIKPFMPKDFNEFFSYLSDNDVQAFAANNEDETTIYGNEGTVVNIPAGAFVNQKGEAVVNINIELKEAYSFGDMLKHNLGTTSGNEILQTGGMIYIDVKDANTGESLNLKQGQEIEINMPSQQALPEGMQLFVADRNTAGDETNWKPIPRAFSSRKIQRIGRPSTTAKRIYENRKPLDQLEIDPELALFEMERAPNYMRKPFRPKMPTQARLLEAELPTLEQLTAKHKRRRGESKKKYAERLEKLLDFKTKVAETTQIKNQRKIEEFQRDSIAYLRKLAQYRVDSSKYENYLMEIEAIVQYLELNVDSIEASVHKIRRQQLATDFQIDLKDLQKSFALKQQYYVRILAEAERIGLTKTKAYLEQYQLFVQDSTKKLIKNERILAQPLKDNYAFWGKIGMNTSNNYHSFIDMDKIRLTKDIKAYSEVELDELAFRLQTIYEKLDRIKSNTKLMNENLERFLKVAQKLQNDQIAEFITSLDEVLKESYNQFTNERIEKGLASDYEKQQYFVNSVRSANLGWINCDRFLRYEGEKMDILVNHEADEATRFFVVFKEMKSVLPLQMGTTGYSSTMYDGVPVGAEVKIIGMRIKDGVSESFVFDGKTEEVANMKIQFRKTKLEEMRKIFDRV
jgi:hypothetical protein